MTSRLRSLLHRARQSPLLWIYVAVVLVRVPGLWWGLPATDGWDNDGVAPRDFLPGLAQTFTPGDYYTYPPLHAALLTLVTLPVVLFGGATAPGFDIETLRTHFLQPAIMTPLAVLARMVSIAFACATVHAISHLAAELVPGNEASQRRVRRWTAAVLAVNVSLAYYGQVSNLDGPYVAWTALAFLALVRALKAPEMASLRGFVLFATCAITTKDQAYASFALSVPAVVLASAASAPTWQQRSAQVGRALVAGAALVALVLCIDGALFNPRGFAARLRFLTGPASQEHGYYTKSIAGALTCLYDAALHWQNYYPYVLAPFTLIGLVLVWQAARKQALNFRRAALALLPLLATLSFTLAFNIPAGRSEHRFLLPQSVFLAVYIGVAMAWMARHRVSRAAALMLVAYAAWPVVGLDVAMWNDPRYAAETWMRQHMSPKASVETYGESVYLPRFPDELQVVRVAPTPTDKRNPVAHATELSAAIADAPKRAPDYIVLPEVWASRYLIVPTPPGFVPTGGYQYPPQLNAVFQDTPTREFVHAMIDETAGYKAVAKLSYEPRWWNKLHLHASVSCDCGIWIYKRSALP